MALMIMSANYIKSKMAQRKPISNSISLIYLRCNTDVMQDAHIPKGAIMAVDRSMKPRNGQVVIAIVDGELLVRRYFKKNYESKLTAPGYRMPEIVISTRIIIFGVVVSVVIQQKI